MGKHGKEGCILNPAPSNLFGIKEEGLNSWTLCDTTARQIQSFPIYRNPKGGTEEKFPLLPPRISRYRPHSYRRHLLPCPNVVMHPAQKEYIPVWGTLFLSLSLSFSCKYSEFRHRTQGCEIDDEEEEEEVDTSCLIVGPSISPPSFPPTTPTTLPLRCARPKIKI